ncbi:MAG: NAD-dependent epimerase/dehydratase [Solirubrobacterales bacterium]|nr:NAD-dependent epimerase/dehydratase [Solirubrobacterales bacterium]
MRVLVTGGSGFIGSHVVDRLRAAGHTPRIFDLRSSPWHDDVDEVLGDITDREALEDALVGCDAVIHLAAVADVSDVHAAPEHAEQVNTHGTVTVLEAARRAEVPRVVYASTIWVYSDCEPENVDEDTPIEPPSHLYSATKYAGELYCTSYAKLYGIDFTILRFGIPYGPRAREAAVVPAFVNKAMGGEPLTIAGDGSQSRRFVYVEDLADGVVRGLCDRAAGRVYNLTGDETVTIKEIAETVSGLIGNTEVVHTPARPGDFGGKLVSSERAARELDWRASTPFAEGVRRYVEWRRSVAAASNGHAPAASNGQLPVARNGHVSVASNGHAPVAAETIGRPRVLVLTADIGAGHDLPAEALARELHAAAPEARISIVNGLTVMGALLTSVVRDGSVVMFRWLPWLFDFQYWLITKVAPTRWLAAKLLSLTGRRRLCRLVRAHDPDVVVSTYPGVTQVLGELRRHGKLTVPCYSSITDLAGLRYWAHPGIDLHFVTHPESVEEVETIAGPGSARWTLPPVSSTEFFEPRAQAEARAALELPTQGKLVVISGGGWGVGDLAGAIATALRSTDAHVLCLCGTNDAARERLARRFPDEARLTLMGFTDRMSDVLAAGDALVHSTAGLTVLEAHIRGCPVISYGFGVGHIRANNRAFERFGLAAVARSQDDLATELDRALAHRPEPETQFASRPTTASVLLDGPPPKRQPAPVWRRVALRWAAPLAAATLLAGWMLSTGDAYAIFARLFHMRPMTTVSTTRPEVGVIVQAPASSIGRLASELALQGVHVSFAVDRVPAQPVLATIKQFGDDALPELRPGGLVRWVGTKGQLHRLTRTLKTPTHFAYVPVSPTIGQYVLARSAGGHAVTGAVRADDSRDLAPLHAGEIIELQVGGVGGNAPALAKALAQQLRDRRLTAVPVGQLLANL